MGIKQYSYDEVAWEYYEGTVTLIINGDETSTLTAVGGDLFGTD